MTMAKTLLGIDVGYESVKLALVSGRRVKKTAIVPMPVNLLKEGRVVSAETMGELLRTAVRQNGMKGLTNLFKAGCCSRMSSKMNERYGHVDLYCFAE